MHRILIVVDNVQFSSHLESTLRKVGYVIEALQSEYNLNERLLSFNPDIVVARGFSSRLSTSNVGRKLRDAVRYTGKTLLVFARDDVPAQEELNKMKYDAILEEPASAFRIAATILNLEGHDKSQMMEKLFKMATDDLIFKAEEEAYLLQHGLNLKDQVRHLHEANAAHDKAFRVLEKSAEQNFPARLQNELKAAVQHQARRIQNYNEQIDNIDVDLKKGLNKRQTKLESKKNRVLWDIDEGKESDLNQERKSFVETLFKKEE